MSRALPLSADERRAASVQALIQLARNADPRQITTAAVAIQMGVSHAALFRHYPDKAALWADAVDWIEQELTRRVEAAAASASTPRAALAAMFEAHARFLADFPGAPRLMLSELQAAGESPAKLRTRGLVARYSERLAGYVVKAQAQGQLRATLVPAMVVNLLLGALQGLVVQALISNAPEQIAAQAEGVFDTLWCGLGTQT